MVKENSNSINLLKEALKVVHSEIFDIRKENEDLKSKNEANQNCISELENRLNDQVPGSVLSEMESAIGGADRMCRG